MSKEAVFTLKLEAELRDAFMTEAEAAHRPASQIVREFMREYVKKQTEAREYDEWLRTDIERAIIEADAPDAIWHAHTDSIEQARQSLQKRLSKASPAE